MSQLREKKCVRKENERKEEERRRRRRWREVSHTQPRERALVYKFTVWERDRLQWPPRAGTVSNNLKLPPLSEKKKLYTKG